MHTLATNWGGLGPPCWCFCLLFDSIPWWLALPLLAALLVLQTGRKGLGNTLIAWNNITAHKMWFTATFFHSLVLWQQTNNYPTYSSTLHPNGHAKPHANHLIPPHPLAHPVNSVYRVFPHLTPLATQPPLPMPHTSATPPNGHGNHHDNLIPPPPPRH
jgi:hypothetical protein